MLTEKNFYFIALDIVEQISIILIFSELMFHTLKFLMSIRSISAWIIKVYSICFWEIMSNIFLFFLRTFCTNQFLFEKLFCLNGCSWYDDLQCGLKIFGHPAETLTIFKD